MSVFKPHNKSNFLKKYCRGLNDFSLNKNKRLLELALSKSLRNSYIKYPLIIAIHIGYEDDILENFRFISNKFIERNNNLNNEVNMLIKKIESDDLKKKFVIVDESFKNLKQF